MAVTLSSNLQSVVLPLMTETFNGRFAEHPTEWSLVFKEGRPIEKSSHIEPVLSTMVAAKEKAEGAPYFEDNMEQVYQAEYPFYTYVVGGSLSEEAEEDGSTIGVARLMARNAADSVVETHELLGADILNRGFTALALGGYGVGDGLPLFSAQHAANNSATGSNIGTPAAISEAAIEELLILAANFRDAKGNYRRVMPKRLVVATANQFQATRILHSMLRSGTNNNDVNAIKDMGLLSDSIGVMRRLTNQRAFYVTTDAPQGGQVFFRAKAQTSTNSDPITNNKLFRARTRLAFGFTNWSGIYGNAGL